MIFKKEITHPSGFTIIQEIGLDEMFTGYINKSNWIRIDVLDRDGKYLPLSNSGYIKCVDDIKSELQYLLNEVEENITKYLIRIKKDKELPDKIKQLGFSLVN